MKSRTSFSKLTSFKKDIFRFAPVWVLYIVVMMMLLVGQGGYAYDRFACNVITEIIPGFGVVNLIYAALVGQMLFGDLYNTRMCYSLHSLPQRRESWLLSHLSAGMIFSLVPNFLVSLFLMARLQNYWYIALLWLLAMTLQYLFFFGVAAVSALLSGNRFAMLAIYAGFNFVSMLAYATVQYLYIPTITGVVVNISDFTQFCPVVHLYEFEFLDFVVKDIPVPGKPSAYDTFYEFTGLADGWGYTAIFAVVGLAAMGIAVWLYRLRHLESAGDFIAFPKLKGIACVIITVCVTLCFAVFGEMFDGGLIIWLPVGVIVGYFGSLMLLERRIKVFRKKTFLGFGILVIVTILSFCAVAMDWFGIEAWTPSADRVESVTVANYKSSDYYYDYYGDRLKVTLEDQADIEKIIEAHEDILSRLDFRAENPNAKTHRVTLTYKMKSGRTVVRSYNAPAYGINYDIIIPYLYNRDSVLGFEDPVAAAQKVEYMYLRGLEVSKVDYVRVLQAVQMDFDAGHIEYVEKNGDHYLEYTIDNGKGNSEHHTIFFTEKAVNLMAILKSPELQMGYTDWSVFLQQVASANMDGMTVTGEHLVQLLEAIRKDVESGNLIADDFSQDTLFVVEYQYLGKYNMYYFRNFCVHKYAENTMTWIEEYMQKTDEWNPEGV